MSKSKKMHWSEIQYATRIIDDYKPCTPSYTIEQAFEEGRKDSIRVFSRYLENLKNLTFDQFVKNSKDLDVIKFRKQLKS